MIEDPYAEGSIIQVCRRQHKSTAYADATHEYEHKGKRVKEGGWSDENNRIGYDRIRMRKLNDIILAHRNSNDRLPQ